MEFLVTCHGHIFEAFVESRRLIFYIFQTLALIVFVIFPGQLQSLALLQLIRGMLLHGQRQLLQLLGKLLLGSGGSIITRRDIITFTFIVFCHINHGWYFWFLFHEFSKQRYHQVMIMALLQAQLFFRRLSSQFRRN